MRLVSALVMLSLFSFAALAQTAAKAVQRPPVTPPGLQRCCTAKAYDATGKVIGDLIRWDDRFASIPLQAVVRYPIAGGGDVALLVAPESISGMQGPGGSVALFTTADCSGNTMFAQLGWPPMMKRYGMVLPVAAGGGFVNYAATKAWLWATDPLPVRPVRGRRCFSRSGATAARACRIRRRGTPWRRRRSAATG